MQSMKPLRCFLAVFLVMAWGAWPSYVLAQATQFGAPGPPGMERPQVPGAAAPSGPQKQVQGKIKSVDSSGRRITLDDGTRLTIPPTLGAERGSLAEGQQVVASYEEKGGQNVVTSLEVQPQSR